jgi:hypothetical protein
MQKCSFNHAIPVFQRRQEHARHEGRPSQAVKKEGLNHLKLKDMHWQNIKQLKGVQRWS